MPIVSLRRPRKTERVRLPLEPEDIRLNQEIYDHRSDRNPGAGAETEARLPQQVPRRSRTYCGSLSGLLLTSTSVPFRTAMPATI
jgi:hypothetical protein